MFHLLYLHRSINLNKKVLMKKLVTLVSAVFVFTNMSAQLKVHSNGNVGIQSSVTPEAALTVGAEGSLKGAGYKIYAH